MKKLFFNTRQSASRTCDRTVLAFELDDQPLRKQETKIVDENHCKNQCCRRAVQVFTCTAGRQHCMIPYVIARDVNLRDVGWISLERHMLFFHWQEGRATKGRRERSVSRIRRSEEFARNGDLEGGSGGNVLNVGMEVQQSSIFLRRDFLAIPCNYMVPLLGSRWRNISNVDAESPSSGPFLWKTLHARDGVRS